MQIEDYANLYDLIIEGARCKHRHEGVNQTNDPARLSALLVSSLSTDEAERFQGGRELWMQRNYGSEP